MKRFSFEKRWQTELKALEFRKDFMRALKYVLYLVKTYATKVQFFKILFILGLGYVLMLFPAYL